ncbi:transcriptional activator NhaR [Sterolibacterium denitrificans]|uniref:transcriptional activator NhaR n=1 Tax=Sterolibacterium denitrificans TaxID=157592 RepID=UPI0012B69147|nr:transcriptional activator NhaR [Sterolibacterium denitrificans]
MSRLNYKHLRYFWMVARAGSIARAAEQLHLTPQSISTQLGALEASLGVALFQRAGRGLELSEAGRRILHHAEEIFTLGDELLEAAHDESRSQRALPLRIGIADSVAKSVVQRVIAPALQLAEPMRLICREGRLDLLLAELAVHRLDMVIADRPMPSNLNVRGYSHLLGESELAIFAAPALAATLPLAFPALLDNAPLLLPGEDVAIRHRLEHWLAAMDLRPRIIGEFDDNALLTAFAQAGAGLFFAPAAIADDLCRRHEVVELGRVATIREQLYAITTERRLTHPAIVAIRDTARDELFGKAGQKGRQARK